MIKIKEVIIVEGRYDRQKLLSIFDTIIIETRGFRIFKDKKKKEYITKLANERGLVILTDSDGAGFVIRNHLKSFINNKQIKNAYIPQIDGKEKRKEKSSAEGILGVEGMSEEIIVDALKKSGVSFGENNINNEDEIPDFTVSDLYNFGFTGTENSAINREKFLGLLNLPSYMSTKDLIKYMNMNKKNTDEKLKEFFNNGKN